MPNSRISRILTLTLLITSMVVGGVDAKNHPKTKIVINIPSRTLWLYSGDQLVRYYPVGVGRTGFSTPIGEHKVIRKIINPGWENPYRPQGQSRIKPGRSNPLGTRWIGFKQDKGGEFGIHGTNNPSSVGRFSSHGCVRMKIPDAEDLFEQVDLGTPVIVTYDTALIRRHGNEIKVASYPDTFRKGGTTAARVKADILKQYPQAIINDVALLKTVQTPTQRYIAVGTLPVPEKNTPPSKHPSVEETPITLDIQHKDKERPVKSPPLPAPPPRPALQEATTKP